MSDKWINTRTGEEYKITATPGPSWTLSDEPPPNANDGDKWTRSDGAQFLRVAGAWVGSLG